MMKSLSIMLVVMILAGCATSTGTSGASGTGGVSSSDQMNINRHDDPRDIYFGG
ncbi:MAG: hypothetical protein ACREX0_14430 [Noviherbaspirillum sp.]